MNYWALDSDTYYVAAFDLAGMVGFVGFYGLAEVEFDLTTKSYPDRSRAKSIAMPRKYTSVKASRPDTGSPPWQVCPAEVQTCTYLILS